MWANEYKVKNAENEAGMIDKENLMTSEHENKVELDYGLWICENPHLFRIVYGVIQPKTEYHKVRIIFLAPLKTNLLVHESVIHKSLQNIC